MIRKARPDEFDAVAALTVAAYEEYAERIGEEHWADYRASLANVARRAARGAVLVAEAGGRLVGAVTYYPPIWDKGEAVDWDGGWWPADYGYLRALAVLPDARGLGIGRSLTLACVERARAEGATGIALNTAHLMETARKLYERLGFCEIPNTFWEPSGNSDWDLLFYTMPFEHPATILET